MLTLRVAGRADKNRLLAWRNDPETRRSAFVGEEVRVEEHHTWLQGKLADPGCLILIAELDGVAIGQVRFDRESEGIAKVDVTVDPQARGAGLGRDVLIAGMAEAARCLSVRSFLAQVKADNLRSLGAFRGAGFAMYRDGADGVVELRCNLTRDS